MEKTYRIKCRQWLAIGLLICTTHVLAKDQVATSPQVCPPDGYITVNTPTAVSALTFPVRVEKGRFRYCLKSQYSLITGDSCTEWGDATAYLQKQTARSDVIYAGMGVRAWGSHDIYLFYCVSAKD